MRSTILKILVLSLDLLIIVSCDGQGMVKSPLYDSLLVHLLEHNVPEVNVQQLEGKGIIYLDAREKNEYVVSHIDGAIWVGYDDFKVNRVKKIPKQARIVVYCSVGYRSEKVTQKLLSKGYTNASNLYGGIFEWVNEGNAVVDKASHKTKKIHAYNLEWGIWLLKGEKVY